MIKYSCIVLVLITFSCKAQTLNNELPNRRAMVLVGVSMAADGCGNLVQIDSSLFHAKNLPTEFIQDSLWVDISFKIADSIYCGRGRYPMPAIEILNISSVK